MKQKLKSLLKRSIPKKYYPQLGDIYRNYFLYLRNFGNRFECPFCGGHFRKLLPKGFDFPVLKEMIVIGGGYRQNVMCPCCYSSDRERLIYLYLKKINNLFYESLGATHNTPQRIRMSPQEFGGTV